MTAEMGVQLTLALLGYINPSVEIGKQGKLKLYWLAL